MLSFLATGTILGLSAGFAPGPLLALVVSETLQHDMTAGVKVAMAPVLTDLPIIIFTLFILAKLSRFHHVLGVISIIGACFILYLAIKDIKTKKVDINQDHSAQRSLQKGILVNALSPYPYLFAAVSFIGSFYVLLVGAKIVLAGLIGRYRGFLQGNTYIFTIRSLGIVLIILAGILFRDGLHLLGLF